MRNWATDFMSIQLWGNINVALVFGLLQFLTTFLLAWLYSRYSTSCRLDDRRGDAIRAAVRYDECRALLSLDSRARCRGRPGRRRAGLRFVCGIYARTDVDRGVWKAPANEVVRLAVGLATAVTKQQQDVLNPLGITAFDLSGPGHAGLGRPDTEFDSEWTYVSQRRYFQHLGRSIERGIAWAAFAPNGPSLWAALTASVENFLTLQWRNGALVGTEAGDAFFVRCDRTTMTQNDLDNGRVVILIGLALLKPAEFVIFRIGVVTEARDG